RGVTLGIGIDQRQRPGGDAVGGDDRLADLLAQPGEDVLPRLAADGEFEALLVGLLGLLGFFFLRVFGFGLLLFLVLVVFLLLALGGGGGRRLGGDRPRIGADSSRHEAQNKRQPDEARQVTEELRLARPRGAAAKVGSYCSHGSALSIET